MKSCCISPYSAHSTDCLAMQINGPPEHLVNSWIPSKIDSPLWNESAHRELPQTQNEKEDGNEENRVKNL